MEKETFNFSYLLCIENIPVISFSSIFNKGNFALDLACPNGDIKEFFNFYEQKKLGMSHVRL